MKRQGRDDSRQLAQVAAAADLSKWPGPVLKLDVGKMTAGEVMAAAASPGTFANEPSSNWQFSGCLLLRLEDNNQMKEVGKPGGLRELTTPALVLDLEASSET
jgi:hypothetical protein